MKKAVAVFLFLCLVSVAFADESTVGTVSGMIKSGLFKNQDQIKSLSPDLNTTEKWHSTRNIKKDQWGTLLGEYGGRCWRRVVYSR